MSRDRLTRRALGAAALLGSGLATGGAASAPSHDRRRALLEHWALNTESWWTESLPFERRFDAAARLGFTKVEFWNVAPPERDVRALARLCRDAGVEPVQVTVAVPRVADPATPLQTFKDQIAGSLERCAVLGTKMATVTGHEEIAGLSKGELLARYQDRMAAAAPLAEAAGVTLIVEPFNPYNHPGTFLLGSQDAVRLCRAIGSPAVKINWDLFHMQRAEGNVVDAFRKGADQCAYVQIADSPDRKEPGTGEVNWAWTLKAVRQAGYRGPVGLELWPTKGREAEIATALAALADAALA